jgi:hypothetical protein
MKPLLDWRRGGLSEAMAFSPQGRKKRKKCYTKTNLFNAVFPSKKGTSSLAYIICCLDVDEILPQLYNKSATFRGIDLATLPLFSKFGESRKVAFL